MTRRVPDWLDERSGYRTGLRHLLDESLPPGTGWWFTLGSVLLFLLTVQLATGAFLTLYYAPTPDHAYASVRFITEDVTLGWLVRGLHYFGASFIVVFAGVHLLRVVAFGSYKRPRELTWLSGVAMLLVILAFALTGYLLPWDQRAYWATVVTINIARSAPLAGELAASILRGGAEIGALTLSRWYAVHVVLLPGVLVLLVTGHLFLMRRHGISGPIAERPGPRPLFYPEQAARDLVVILGAAAVLLALAWRGVPPLERMADPTDASYVPRPEWYFLSLFQLLKYFPGPLEPLAAHVVPALAVLALVLLPWLDRGAARDPRRRPIVMGGVGVGVLAVAVLTALGWRDRPPARDPGLLTPREIAGQVWLEAAGCATCHGNGSVAGELGRAPLSRPPFWLAAHVADPEVIAPGVREAPVVNEREIEAIVAWVRRLADGDPIPEPPARDRPGALVFARFCVGCHTIDGDGGDDGPNLSRVGATREREWLRRWITNPRDVDPDANMPAFGRQLSAEQIDTIAAYLASRR